MYVLWLLDACSKILLKTSRFARVIEQIIATCTKQPQNIHNYQLSFEKTNTCVTAKYYHIHKKQIIIKQTQCVSFQTTSLIPNLKAYKISKMNWNTSTTNNSVTHGPDESVEGGHGSHYSRQTWFLALGISLHAAICLISIFIAWVAIFKHYCQSKSMLKPLKLISSRN